MKRTKQEIAQGEAAAKARAVPLVVPHTGATACDVESALDLVRRDGRVHKLWQGTSAKRGTRRVS